MTLDGHIEHLEMDKQIAGYMKALQDLRGICMDESASNIMQDKMHQLWGTIDEFRKALETRHKELYALSRVKDQINAGVTLDEILDSAYESFREMIPYNRIGFALIEDDGKFVRARWARSDASKPQISADYSAVLHGSSLQQIVDSKKPRIINDLEMYLREHPGSESTRKIVEEGMRSSLTCPLIVNGKPIGFLFFSSMKPHTYDNAHVEFFLEIARHVSLSVEKARLYQELADLNQMKNKLLGIAAHDLRNPIGIVKGFADLMKSGAFGETNEAQKNCLVRIMRNCQSMLDLINDLLDISTIESGRLDLRLKEVDLAAYLAEFLVENRVMAKAKEIDLRAECPDNLPLIVFDPERVGQALHNLVGNAIKYSYPQSAITMIVRKDEDNIEIAVRDEGQGISPDEIPRLFVDYTRGSSRPTGGEKSTGLGLAIVRRIVKAHNGELKVESEIGKGSVFTIILPISGPKITENSMKMS